MSGAEDVHAPAPVLPIRHIELPTGPAGTGAGDGKNQRKPPFRRTRSRSPDARDAGRTPIARGVIVQVKEALNRCRLVALVKIERINAANLDPVCLALS